MTELHSIQPNAASADEPLIDVVTEDAANLQAAAQGGGQQQQADPMLAEQTVEMVEVYDEDGNGVLMTLDEYHAMYGEGPNGAEYEGGAGPPPHLNSTGPSQGGPEGDAGIVGDGGFTAANMADHDPFEEQQTVSGT